MPATVSAAELRRRPRKLERVLRVAAIAAGIDLTAAHVAIASRRLAGLHDVQPGRGGGFALSDGYLPRPACGLQADEALAVELGLIGYGGIELVKA